MNKIFDGKKESLKVKEDLKNRLKKNLNIGIIQLGDDANSNIFIRQKINFAKDIGVNVNLSKFPEGYKDLGNIIDEFNKDKELSAYIIQLPLLGYKNLNILNNINENKDIDCLNKINYAKVLVGEYSFAPGVFRAFLYILNQTDISKDMNILIIGGGFVGRLIANYLISNNYNVTVLDKYSKDISLYLGICDVIILATGLKEQIKKEQIKKDSYIINIGASSDFEGNIISGIEDDCIDKTKFFVPLKGGIGPMTVAMLFYNLLFL